MHSPLLTHYLPLFSATSAKFPVLDLACGNGRNGIFCLENNLPVVFADIQAESLEQIKNSIAIRPINAHSSLASFWTVDFENGNSDILPVQRYGGIIVFRYLHRPLMQQIKNAIVPGGIVIYETFTTEQVQYGRPKNPDFLLQLGELQQYFSDWQIHYLFEGVISSDNTNKQAIAQIVAQKPQ